MIRRTRLDPARFHSYSHWAFVTNTIYLIISDQRTCIRKNARPVTTTSGSQSQSQNQEPRHGPLLQSLTLHRITSHPSISLTVFAKKRGTTRCRSSHSQVATCSYINTRVQSANRRCSRFYICVCPPGGSSAAPRSAALPRKRVHYGYSIAIATVTLDHVSLEAAAATNEGLFDRNEQRAHKKTTTQHRATR